LPSTKVDVFITKPVKLATFVKIIKGLIEHKP
jgi:hypothetical protein